MKVSKTSKKGLEDIQEGRIWGGGEEANKASHWNMPLNKLQMACGPGAGLDSNPVATTTELPDCG